MSSAVSFPSFPSVHHIYENQHMGGLQGFTEPIPNSFLHQSASIPSWGRRVGNPLQQDFNCYVKPTSNRVILSPSHSHLRAECLDPTCWGTLGGKNAMLCNDGWNTDSSCSRTAATAGPLSVKTSDMFSMTLSDEFSQLLSAAGGLLDSPTTEGGRTVVESQQYTTVSYSLLD